MHTKNGYDKCVCAKRSELQNMHRQNDKTN